jgi:uroporphyrinogen decarboxylase
LTFCRWIRRGAWHRPDRLVNYLEGGHWAGETGARQLPNGLTRNPFGYDYRSGNIMHVERLALPEPTLGGFEWPEAESLADWDLLHRGFDACPAFRHCGMIYGFFERASFMRGMANLLMDMVEHPQFVHDLLDEYLRIRLGVIDRIIERVPCEAIADGGDDCGQRGPLMGLPRWQEFIKPRLEAVIDHCHAKGFPVIAHMCGNVAPLIDDLLEMKLDALESLQPEAMDVYAVKAKVAGKMVLIGGLGTQQMLPRGTPDEVAAETRRLCDEMGAGGGYILGPAKPLMPDVPTENAVAFIEATLDQQVGSR